MAEKDMQWYTNPQTGEVAQGPAFDAMHRMGPYASKEEAQRALETAAEKTAQADDYDAADDDWGVAPQWDKN